MTPQAEKFSHEALLTEQAEVQTGKFKGRSLAEYNSYIFSGANAVTDFLRSYFHDPTINSLDDALINVCNIQGNKTAHWVDMGGGHGIAMREMSATHPTLRSQLAMTNVDLFDYGLEGLSPQEIHYLESARPQLLQTDAETVTLPQAANIITAIEVMQYLNNPLAAIANWYNQLHDNGMLIIAAEHNIASRLGYNHEGHQLNDAEAPTAHILAELAQHAIKFATAYDNDWQNGFRPPQDPRKIRTLAIRKESQTALHTHANVTQIATNHYGFKTIYYEYDPNISPLVVESM